MATNTQHKLFCSWTAAGAALQTGPHRRHWAVLGGGINWFVAEVSLQKHGHARHGPQCVLSQGYALNCYKDNVQDRHAQNGQAVHGSIAAAMTRTVAERATVEDTHCSQRAQGQPVPLTMRRYQCKLAQTRKKHFYRGSAGDDVAQQGPAQKPKPAREHSRAHTESCPRQATTARVEAGQGKRGKHSESQTKAEQARRATRSS